MSSNTSLITLSTAEQSAAAYSVSVATQQAQTKKNGEKASSVAIAVSSTDAITNLVALRNNLFSIQDQRDRDTRLITLTTANESAAAYSVTVAAQQAQTKTSNNHNASSATAASSRPIHETIRNIAQSVVNGEMEGVRATLRSIPNSSTNINFLYLLHRDASLLEQYRRLRFNALTNQDAQQTLQDWHEIYAQIQTLTNNISTQNTNN